MSGNTLLFLLQTVQLELSGATDLVFTISLDEIAGPLHFLRKIYFLTGSIIEIILTDYKTLEEAQKPSHITSKYQMFPLNAFRCFCRRRCLHTPLPVLNFPHVPPYL